MSTPTLREQIALVRERCEGPFGVNFHMFQPNAAEVIDTVIAHRDRIRAVSYGRGPDAKTIARFKQAGILCMPTVGALKHAQKAVELGADLITVQGGEGGGHTGSVPTTLLLPQVLDAVKVPVVAAGGFHSGRGLAGALAFGAAGIAMGTRFLMTAESPVPRATLQRYLDVRDAAHIRASTALDGMPQRMIDNEFLLRLERGGLPSRLLVALRLGAITARAAGGAARAQHGAAAANADATSVRATTLPLETTGTTPCNADANRPTRPKSAGPARRCFVLPRVRPCTKMAAAPAATRPRQNSSVAANMSTPSSHSRILHVTGNRPPTAATMPRTH